MQPDHGGPADPARAAGEDDESLRAEVERLRAELERLRSSDPGARPPRPARALALRGARVLLLTLGCLLFALSVVAIWARVVLLDTDRYVQTVAPLAESPEVQRLVADRIGDRLTAAVNAEDFAREFLPPRAEPLATPIGRAVDGEIRSLVAELVASPRFQQAWNRANRRAHALVIELVTGEQVGSLRLEGANVVLDLGELIERVKARLRERGLGPLVDRIPLDVDRDVVLFQSPALERAAGAVRLLKGLAIVLPVLALAALAGYVALSERRRRALVRAALGVGVAMVALAALLALGRAAYLSALDPAVLPRDVAATVFDVLVRALRTGVRVAFVIALVVAALALLAGHAPGRWTQARWTRLALSAPGRWIAGHRAAVMLGAAAIGAVVLVASDAPSATLVLADLGLVALVVALVAALAGVAPSPESVRTSADATAPP
jgi:hypothetical protein